MLKGSEVILREPIEEDFELLISIRNDVALQKMLMALPRANSYQRVKEWVNSHLNNPRSIFFIIAEKMTNKTYGYIQFVNIHFTHGFGELGICLAPSEQGKGYGQEAILLLEKYLYTVFNIRKVILQVLSENKAAVSLYYKLGYSEVGRYKQHFYHNRQFHDVTIMEKMLHSS